MKRLTQEEAEQKSKEVDSLLIGKYIGNHKKTKFQCPQCGKPFKRTPSNVWQHKQILCIECSIKQSIQKRCLTQEEVKRRFQKNGWILIDKYNNVYTKVKAQCVCGKIILIMPHDIFTNNTKSCGHCNDVNIGDKFGKLTVIEVVTNFIGDRRCRVKCICECGGIWQGKFSKIKSGDTKSCGCLISQGEEIIKQILTNWNINFISQQKFDTCKNQKPLPFDFYLPYYNLLIEYQGQQHYREHYLWEKSQTLEQRQKHDKIKQQWCEANNINLLVIKYTEYNKIEEILKGIIE